MLKVYPSLEEAVDQMVTYERSYYPDIENHKKYQMIYELYKSFYPETKDWMHRFFDTFENI